MKIPYNELYEAYLIASQERYKYKEILDKIKEIIKASDDCLIDYDEMDKKIHKLLEEIE